MKKEASILNKIIKAGALTLVATLGLAGCTTAGGGGSSGSSGSGTGSNSKQVLNIIMWVNPPAVNVVKKIDKEFEQKYPNITVNLQTAASTNYNTLMQTSVQGQTADIMAIHPFQPMPHNMSSKNLLPTQSWAVNNVYLNLNNQPWVKDFKKSDLNAATYNGNVDGLVTGVYQFGVFYNKAMFAKYNLNVPTTYTQLIQDAQILKTHNVTPFFDGLQNVGANYLTFILNPLMQDLWYTKAGNLNTALWNNKVKWTDPAFIQAMTEEKQIMHYLEPNFTGVSWQSMPGAFADGKAAMLLDGSWDLAAVHTANPNMKIGYFPLPGSNNPQDNSSTTSPDLTWTVLNNSPHKAAALKWLDFFSTPTIYEQYVDATGISPSRNGGTYKSVASESLGSWFGKGVTLSNSNPSLPAAGPYWLQLTNWWQLQLEMYQGKYTPKQVANMYQSGWNQVAK